MNRTTPPLAAPVRSHAALKEYELTDALFRGIALAHGAEEVSYPILIARDALRAAEYDRAFPHLLMGGVTARNPNAEPDQLFSQPNLTAPAWFLSPAVCYHTYAQFAGRVLDRPLIVTARGRCFRNEDRERVFGRRQVEFEMREIVLLGPEDWIATKLPQFQYDIATVAAELGLKGEWQAAEDPFFLPTAQGKAHMQRLLETKKEYCLPGLDPLAVASINRHGTFFGERFAIRNADRSFVHTACVAFGLDRWAATRKPNPDPS